MLPESYIYRKAVGDRDLGAENWDIVERNFDMLFKRIHSRGLWFIIGLLGMFAFSIIEVILNTLQYHAMKPYKVMELKETNINDLIKSKPDDMVEALETANWLNEVSKPSETHESSQPNDFMELRDYLYSHDMTLTAKVVKSIRHNVPDDVILEYMHSGKILKPYLTEYIDFGKDVNKMLQGTIGNVISFKKSKLVPYPCAIVLNSETEKIENELQKVFCNSEIRIKFDTDEE